MVIIRSPPPFHLQNDISFTKVDTIPNVWKLCLAWRYVKTLKNFENSFYLDSLIDKPTCYKSINPACIDLILANKKNDFMKLATFEIGISDHHKLITTVLRKIIGKDSSKMIFYRGFKAFDQKKFQTELKVILLEAAPHRCS